MWGWRWKTILTVLLFSPRNNTLSQNKDLASFVFTWPWALFLGTFSAGNYMFRVNRRNTRTRCKVCSNLTIKTPEWHHCHFAVVFLLRVRIKRIAIAKCNLFFHYRHAKEISFYYFRDTNFVQNSKKRKFHLYCWDYVRKVNDDV